MLHRLKLGCSLLILKFLFATTWFLSLTALSPALAGPQGDLKSRHGDWEVRCEKSADGKRDHCALMQSVRRGDAGLTVVVLKPAGGRAMLRVLAPLGVVLASDQRDLRIDVDDANFGYFAIVRCIPDGCVAEHVMTDADLRKLISGRVAIFTVQKTTRESISLPVSLSGFTAGYNALP